MRVTYDALKGALSIKREFRNFWLIKLNNWIHIYFTMQRTSRSQLTEQEKKFSCRYIKYKLDFVHITQKKSREKKMQILQYICSHHVTITPGWNSREVLFIPHSESFFMSFQSSKVFSSRKTHKELLRRYGLGMVLKQQTFASQNFPT